MVARLAGFDSPQTQPAAIDITAFAERAAKKAEAAAQAEADERRRISVAQSLWQQSVPVAGTVAETYLMRTRAIPAPASGWPDSALRFHPGSRALILAMTDGDGAVRAVQRVMLTEAGTKAPSTGGPAKQTNGVMAGAAVRLPGDARGPLLLAEGPETAVTLWVATGFETHAMLGSISKAHPKPGRTIIACCDDDAPGAPSAVKVAAAIAEWRAAGVDVLVAWPWPERRGDRSDFNDVAIASGLQAVRDAVACATSADAEAATAAALGPYYPRPTLNGAAASRRLRRIVCAWLDRVELHLEARDWIAVEAARVEPDVCAATCDRIRRKLIRDGANEREAEEAATARALKVAPRLAKRAAKVAAVTRFGKRAAEGVMPRIQVQGAAGLGKTQAFIAEYLRRPSLWRRHIAFYTPTLELADAFANDVAQEAERLGLTGIEGGPRAIVIRGRQSAAMCRPERLPVVAKAQQAGVDSVFRAVCHSPAVGNARKATARFGAAAGISTSFGTRRRPYESWRMHVLRCVSQPNWKCRHRTWWCWTSPRYRRCWRRQRSWTRHC